MNISISHGAANNGSLYSREILSDLSYSEFLNHPKLKVDATRLSKKTPLMRRPSCP